MAEFNLSNGYILTDDEIEARAQEWEDGTWEGHLVQTRAGRPSLSDEPNTCLSFKCPQTRASMIEQAAKACGVTKSGFIRDAAIEKAEKILAS